MFSQEFEKIAKPRWAAEIAKGSLSSKSIKALRSIIKKEREVSHLGMGVEQIADLVMSPKHGLSVRKIPKVKSTHMRSLKDALGASKNRAEMWEHVKAIDPGGDFAHILGKTKGKPITYHEYVKPGAREIGSRIDKLKASFAISAKKIHQAHSRWLADHPGKPIPEDIINPYRRTGRHATLLMKMLRSTPNFNDKTLKSIKKIKEKYPDLRDLHQQNFLGGKIIDMSPAPIAVTFHAEDVWKPDLPLRDYAKRLFLHDK